MLIHTGRESGTQAAAPQHNATLLPGSTSGLVHALICWETPKKRRPYNVLATHPPPQHPPTHPTPTHPPNTHSPTHPTATHVENCSVRRPVRSELALLMTNAGSIGHVEGCTGFPRRGR